MNYYKKYLKYKNKLFGGEATYTIIPKNTYWWRTAPNICNYNSDELCKLNSNICSDTGKKGIYFGDRAIASIAMCLEYDKLLEIGVFQLVEDVKVSIDKYEFRKINPDRYFDKDGNFIRGVKPTEDENISHVKCGLQLLKMNELKSDVEILLPFELQNELDISGCCELFLSYNDVNKIKLIDKFKFNPDIIKTPDDLLLYMQNKNYPFDIDEYINDNIFIKFDCPDK